MESFRWVKHSPIYESNLAPLNQGQYSLITLGWFGPKGWNSLLIELFRPQLCSNGSRRGWIRLLPAVLNWNFGGATDLFNFQCGMVEMGWSFFDSLLNTGLLRGKRHERDSQVPCKVPSRPNPTTRKGWPHHRGVRPLPFSNSGVGSFRKSDHLQMSLQRQHFLLSYLKTLSVGQAGVWTRYLPLSRPVLFHLSSPRGGTNSTPWKEPYIPRVFHCLLLFLLEVLWEQLFWNNRKEQFLIIFF